VCSLGRHSPPCGIELLRGADKEASLSRPHPSRVRRCRAETRMPNRQTRAQCGNGLNTINSGVKPMKFPSTASSHRPPRRGAIGLIAAALTALRSAFAENYAILVHKDPTCGCCTGWVQHLARAGFAVTVQETADLKGVRKRLGVPADIAACHTAEIQDMESKAMFRHRPSVNCWSNGQPPSGLPFPACLQDPPAWRAARRGDTK
jgi:hypothetical protein